MYERIIQFYEGDVEGNDSFYSDPKAYVTWNALLFPNITTEIARSEEGRYLNPSFLECPERIIDLTLDLYKKMNCNENDQIVYRVERYSDYKVFLKEKRLCTFLSTSTKGFLNAYQDKIQLVLMRITIPKGVKCLDFSKELDLYKKQEEKEILLPPYLTFESQLLDMDERILSIHDRNNQSPVVYCDMKVGQFDYVLDEIKIDIDECIEASKRVYYCLNHKQTLNDSDVNSYILFKKYIQNEIQKRMKEIENEN